MRKPAHRFNPAQPDCTPVSPMRPEIIRHYEQLQAELEKLGKWRKADILNQWLAGAFMSEDDLLEGRMPTMRAEFLERMRSA